MNMRFRQFGPLLSSLGIGGCVRYLALGALSDTGEISEYRPTRVALGEVAAPMETVRKASLLSLKRLPGRIQTVTVQGKHARIMATIDERDLFIRMKRISPESTRIAVNVTRPASMGQAAADTVLEQTCRLAREIHGSKRRQRQLKAAAADPLFRGSLAAETGKGEAA